ncbi:MULTISPECIES: hypothetical protein [Microbacterium]|uniref:hypothetical protein n=1 Tax=Microbacterium TaxID=33882 RepID=UPI00344EB975
MTARRSAALLAASALAAALTACAPASTPTPSPTPTGFASEEEAFAAAEATYRAYVDALNQVDLSDPATFEPVYALLTESALDGSKKELTTLHAESLTKTGLTKIDRIERESADIATSSATLLVCLNVSDVDVLDPSGTSVVPAGRNDFQLLSVDFGQANSEPRQLVIENSQAMGDEPCG